jgi:hypothetical protein
MLLLLIPWTAIWVGISIAPLIGAVAGIAVVSMLPLAWIAYRPVFFERISAPMVASLSLAALLGVDTLLIMLASYVLFGLMWLIGAFTKTPLSAHYSQNNYGGQTALANPLFMRTNRILTAAWGVMYIAASLWTVIIMRTPLSSSIGLINSVCPALMGAFTIWFQKWYPAKYARG